MRYYVQSLIIAAILLSFPFVQTSDGGSINYHSRGNSREIDFENATEIDPGDTIIHALDEQNNEIDWYKIKLSDGDIFNVNLTVPLSADFDVAMYDSDETRLARSAGSERFEEFTTPIHITSYYYIKVYAYVGSGSYSLHTSITGTFTPDGDNGPEEATPIALNSTESSDLNREDYDSIDWWNITMNSGDIVTVSLVVPDTGDFGVVVLNSDQNLIGFGDDGGTGADEELEISVIVSGFFYIKCGANEGYGSYTITITKTGTFVPDENNDIDNATAMGLGVTINDDMDENTDEDDWYKINLTEGDVIEVHLTVPPGADFDLVVLNTDRETIKSSQGTGDSEEVTFPVFSTGSYYIHARAYHGSGDYALTATKTGSFTSDGDNSPADSTEIHLNSTESSNLDPENYDPEDWWKISSLSGDILNFNLTSTDDSLIGLMIYDTEKNMLYSEYNYGRDSFVEIDMGIQNTGWYYICCQAEDVSGSYTLSVRKVGDFIPDNDNNFENATQIELDISFTDSVWENIDNADFYRISIPEDNEILVELSTPEEGDFNIVVGYGEENPIMVYIMDRNGLGVDEMGVFSTLGDGIYFIIIYAEEGKGDYTLTISKYVQDENDDVDEADEIEVTAGDVHIDGLIVRYTDTEDYYNFYLEGADVVLVTLVYSEYDQFSLMLFNSEEDDIQISDDYDGQEVIEYTAESNGWYYLLVKGRYYSGRYSLSIEYTEGNQPPVFESVIPDNRDIRIDENETITFRLQVTDADGTTPVIQWSVDEEPLAGYTNNFYEFKTDYDMAGIYAITVTAMDEEDPAVECTFTWILTVDNLDRAPVLSKITPAEDPKTDEETSVTFHVDASDPDGDAVAYKWYVDGKRVLYADENDFVYEPDYDSASKDFREIKVLVRGGESEVSYSWKVNVSNINRPPIIDVDSVKPEPDSKHGSKADVEFSVNASDPDGDNVTYTWLFIESGKSYDGQKQVRKLKAGTHTIRITASDGNEGEDIFEFKITITKNSEKSPGFGLNVLLAALVFIMVQINLFRGHKK